MRAAFVLALVVVIAWFALSRVKREEVPIEHAPTPSAAAAPSSTPSPSTAPLREALPSVDALREERKKNPHMVPESLRKMAGAMAPRMERALRSEPEASSLMSELEDCVRSNGSDAVKAYCLSNARRLGRTFSGLRKRVDALEAAVPERVLKTLDVLGF
jgi:hypothetical protein